MTSISSCHKPGVLIVYACPKAPIYQDEFNEWYNTEHGPLRLRLDFVKNGYRYRTRGRQETIWAGIYDIDRLSALSETTYTNLRTFRSAREQHLLDTKVDILQRRIGRLVASHGESVGRAPLMMATSFVVQKEEAIKAYQWCNEVHFEALSRLPSWRRSRCYEVMDGHDSQADHIEVLCIDEYDHPTGSSDTTLASMQLKRWHNQAWCSNQIHHSHLFHFYHEFRARDYKQPPHPPDFSYIQPESDDQATTTRIRIDAVPGDDLTALHTAGRFVPPMVY